MSADVALEHVTWAASTNTLTWNLSYSNSFAISRFTGDLSSYETITINASGYSSGNEYRLIFYGPNFDGGQKVLGPFYSNGGTYNFADRGFTKEMLSNITSINLAGGSESGSIVIEKIYLEKPTTVNFDDTGKAYFDWTDISVSGATLSYDDQTGTVTSTGTDGTISISFDKAYDLSALTRWTATMTGTDIVQHWQLVGAKNSGSELDMYSGEFDRAFPGSLVDPDFTAVTGVKMFVNAAGTMTFTSGQMYLTSSVITSSPGNEVAIETLERKYYEGGAWNTGSVTKSYGTAITTALGDGDAKQDEYVDIAGYSELRLYVSSGDPRLFLVKESGFDPTVDGYILTKEGVKQNGQWGGVQDADHKLVKNGDYYYITVADIKAACGGEAKLISVKAEYGQTIDISNIVVVDPNSTYDYMFTGNGPLTSVAIAALNDANAKAINATGITAATALPTANPNCLIVANDGMVTNTKNVIVSGTCANLELKDGKPFKAPSAFTATNAKFTKTFTSALCGTMVIPFDANVPSGIEAYNLTGDNGTTITHTDAASIAANAPVLLKSAAATDYVFTATSAAIAATVDESTNGKLIGTYAGTTAAAGSTNYVLQNGAAGLGFFRVTGTDATIKPFRAYLNTANAASMLSLDFDSLTGIYETEMTKKAGNETFYNLNGQRVAQPAKGLYIVNGKKVVLK